MRPVAAPTNGGIERTVFYCDTCNSVFEVLLKRCPICRRTHKADRKLTLVARKRAKGNIRKGISKSKRARVYARDGHACLACGSVKKLTLDHVLPISQGGTNDEANLQTLCQGCNCSVKRGKQTDYRKAA